MIPYSWVLDPDAVAAACGHPGIEHPVMGGDGALLSQKQRELVLKISGFSPDAWGARGVYVGSDMSGRGVGRDMLRPHESRGIWRASARAAAIHQGFAF